MAHLRRGRHHFDQRRRDRAGIGVHQPQPARPALRGQPLQQPRQPVALAPFDRVGGAVLRDQHQLLRAAPDQLPRLRDQIVRPAAAEQAALDAGDVAERAGPRAAVRNFQVGGRLRGLPRPAGGNVAFRLNPRDPRRPPGDGVPRLDAEHIVDAHDPARIVRLQLRPAARDDQPLAVPLPFRQQARRLFGFRLRVVDEPAGVEDHQIGVGARGLDGAARLQPPRDPRRVGRVLGAAQRDDVVPRHCPSSGCAAGSGGPALMTTRIASPFSSSVPAGGY